MDPADGRTGPQSWVRSPSTPLAAWRARIQPDPECSGRDTQRGCGARGRSGRRVLPAGVPRCGGGRSRSSAARTPGFAGAGGVYLLLQPGDVVAGQLPGPGPVAEVLLLAFRPAQQQPLAGRDANEPRARLAPPRIEASRALQHGQERRRHQVSNIGGLAASAEPHTPPPGHGAAGRTPQAPLGRSAAGPEARRRYRRSCLLLTGTRKPLQASGRHTRVTRRGCGDAWGRRTGRSGVWLAT